MFFSWTLISTSRRSISGIESEIATAACFKLFQIRWNMSVWIISCKMMTWFMLCLMWWRMKSYLWLREFCILELEEIRTFIKNQNFKIWHFFSITCKSVWFFVCWYWQVNQYIQQYRAKILISMSNSISHKPAIL